MDEISLQDVVGFWGDMLVKNQRFGGGYWIQNIEMTPSEEVYENGDPVSFSFTVDFSKVTNKSNDALQDE